MELPVKISLLALNVSVSKDGMAHFVKMVCLQSYLYVLFVLLKLLCVIGSSHGQFTSIKKEKKAKYPLHFALIVYFALAQMLLSFTVSLFCFRVQQLLINFN